MKMANSSPGVRGVQKIWLERISQDVSLSVLKSILNEYILSSKINKIFYILINL